VALTWLPLGAIKKSNTPPSAPDTCKHAKGTDIAQAQQLQQGKELPVVHHDIQHSTTRTRTYICNSAPLLERRPHIQRANGGVP
jgi:hypothetical protein